VILVVTLVLFSFVAVAEGDRCILATPLDSSAPAALQCSREVRRPGGSSLVRVPDPEKTARPGSDPRR